MDTVADVRGALRRQRPGIAAVTVNLIDQPIKRPTIELHWTVSFISSWRFLSWSVNFQHSMQYAHSMVTVASQALPKHVEFPHTAVLNLLSAVCIFWLVCSLAIVRPVVLVLHLSHACHIVLLRLLTPYKQVIRNEVSLCQQSTGEQTHCWIVNIFTST